MAGPAGYSWRWPADRVLAAPDIILNPHYKNMGNLYGSEYWTYLLPRRVGTGGVESVMGRRLPIGAGRAVELRLIDGFLGEGYVPSDVDLRIAAKAERLRADGSERPLSVYRERELERMRLNFFGFDPSYHVARFNFIRKVPVSRTPLYLASHRRK